MKQYSLKVLLTWYITYAVGLMTTVTLTKISAPARGKNISMCTRATPMSMHSRLWIFLSHTISYIRFSLSSNAGVKWVEAQGPSLEGRESCQPEQRRFSVKEERDQSLELKWDGTWCHEYYDLDSCILTWAPRSSNLNLRRIFYSLGCQFQLDHHHATLCPPNWSQLKLTLRDRMPREFHNRIYGVFMSGYWFDKNPLQIGAKSDQAYCEQEGVSK